ncbi:MAG: hypothetical protein ABSF20_03310 [Smithella sp.]|jgi:hypothetical protein
METHEEAVQYPDFRDRKTGLVVCGILEIILGVLCALMALDFIVSPTLHNNAARSINAGTIARAGFPAILFIWTGIGSIKTRRWARALSLVLSWIWFLAGVGCLILMLVFMPNTQDQLSPKGQLSKEITVIAKYWIPGLMAVIYAIVPAALVLFYGSRNVKATCELRDPLIRWTDKCPLPVLAVSLTYGLGACLMLSRGFYWWAIPFFGFVLSGMAGSIAALINILLLGYVAWGTYKLKITAWWCAILITVAWALSASITLSRVSLWDLYEKMYFPKQQLEIMTQYIMPHYASIALLSRVWVVCIAGYLLYARRYFASSSV